MLIIGGILFLGVYGYLLGIIAYEAFCQHGPVIPERFKALPPAYIWPSTATKLSKPLGFNLTRKTT